MKIQEIRATPRDREQAPGRAGKAGLIRAIRRREDAQLLRYPPGDVVCDQTGCLWREDCFAAAWSGRHS